MLEILVLEEGVAFESSDTIHSQGEQHTVVIAYPFQASLDCLHCGENSMEWILRTTWTMKIKFICF